MYGRGQYLYDENDQPYLDCINNVTQGDDANESTQTLDSNLPHVQLVTVTHVW